MTVPYANESLDSKHKLVTCPSLLPMKICLTLRGKKKKNNESGNDSFLRTEAKVALSKPLLLNLS